MKVWVWCEWQVQRQPCLLTSPSMTSLYSHLRHSEAQGIAARGRTGQSRPDMVRRHCEQLTAPLAVGAGRGTSEVRLK